jgi:hypothetical protein
MGREGGREREREREKEREQERERERERARAEESVMRGGVCVEERGGEREEVLCQTTHTHTHTHTPSDKLERECV